MCVVSPRCPSFASPVFKTVSSIKKVAAADHKRTCVSWIRGVLPVFCLLSSVFWIVLSSGSRRCWQTLAVKLGHNVLFAGCDQTVMKLGIRCWRGQDEVVVVLAGVLQSHQQFCSRLVMWSFKLAAINQSFWSRVREAVFAASDPVSSVSIPGPMGSFHSPSYHDAVSTASGWTTASAVVFWICLVSATQFPEVQPRYLRLLRSR